MKKLVLAAVVSMLALSACNTISGAGKDVSAAGHAVSNSAETVKEKM
nr:entericidin A/B family lipoprotein [uncultured Kingella sp.]